MIEYEIDEHGQHTGRVRRRQFKAAYAKAAHTGLWPKDRAQIDAWMEPFVEVRPSR